jgi:hypothetical protein
METHFTWRTKLFSRKFDIYENDRQAGYLEKEWWSRRSGGEINGFKIMFATKGFFKQTTRIINVQDEYELGYVEFNFWKFLATIHLNERDFYFRFNNFFNTSWSVGDINEVLINYHSKCLKGTIDSYSDNSVLIITGLYIRNFFRQRQAAVAAST